MTQYNRKDYVQLRNEKWGDEYYTILDTIDRLIEIIRDKYGSLCKASVHYGKSYAYFTYTLYTACKAPRTKTLKELCEFLNVSMDYVVFGTNKEEYTGPKEITYKNFIDMYNTVYKGRKCSSVSSLLSMYNKTGHLQVPLKYLIKVAREQKVTIDWLIGG